MSGGTRSRPARPEGDHPACTTERRKDGDTGRARPKGRLGLDGWGDAGPHFDLKEYEVCLSGLANALHAQGIDAGWPRLQARFTRAQSAESGCVLVLSSFEKNYCGP